MQTITVWEKYVEWYFINLGIYSLILIRERNHQIQGLVVIFLYLKEW